MTTTHSSSHNISSNPEIPNRISEISDSQISDFQIPNLEISDSKISDSQIPNPEILKISDSEMSDSEIPNLKSEILDFKSQIPSIPVNKVNEVNKVSHSFPSEVSNSEISDPNTDPLNLKSEILDSKSKILTFNNPRLPSPPRQQQDSIWCPP